ncbi:MAG: hypothetical protein JO352_30605 [Chloroflexi bacterium]|nr:hypothetical protein [Chloroflexota bacterium]MBV9596135.1 hypothetical protein [Chloroflexota bacterium]
MEAEVLLMHRQVGATLDDTRPAAWSADAIIERDRRDFDASLKAQAERLMKRNSEAPRD